MAGSNVWMSPSRRLEITVAVGWTLNTNNSQSPQLRRRGCLSFPCQRTQGRSNNRRPVYIGKSPFVLTILWHSNGLLQQKIRTVQTFQLDLDQFNLYFNASSTSICRVLFVFVFGALITSSPENWEWLTLGQSVAGNDAFLHVGWTMCASIFRKALSVNNVQACGYLLHMFLKAGCKYTCVTHLIKSSPTVCFEVVQFNSIQ